MKLAMLAILTFVTAAAAPTAHAEGDGVHYLYLVRYGIYDRDENADDVTGNGINELGREQAQLVGTRLATAPIHYAHLVSSNLRRAVETAEVMAPPGSVCRIVDSQRAQVHFRRTRPGVKHVEFFTSVPGAPKRSSRAGIKI